MERFANLAYTTLDGAILAGDLTLVVADASDFPTTGDFRLIIEDEILLVTGVSGTTFTVTRGIEGTSAVGHGDGTVVRHILTAGAMDQFRTDLVESLGRNIFDLHNGIATNTNGFATIIGATYVDASLWPVSRTVKFRCILESSDASATYAATADLFDTGANLGATPDVVSGSQIDNTGVADPTVASMVEVDVTAAFAGFSGAGIFEARLWIASSGDGNSAVCKKAQILVE